MKGEIKIPIENPEEVKVIREYLVKLGNVQEPIKCRIIKTKDVDLPFTYEAEFLSELEPIDCETHEEACQNLSEYLSELIEPRQVNNNY
jgi:hypothetical protein